MSKSVKIKSEFLGMSYGTAANRLRKMILFKCVQELNKDICYRCGEKIEDIRDLSIEHKEPWLHESVELFWDLDNVAFSHLSCNCRESSGGPQKIEWPEGQAWCWKCKMFKKIEDFKPSKVSRRDEMCKICCADVERKRKRKSNHS